MLKALRACARPPAQKVREMSQGDYFGEIALLPEIIKVGLRRALGSQFPAEALSLAAPNLPPKLPRPCS